MTLRSVAKSSSVLVLASLLAGCGVTDTLLPNQMSQRSIEGVQSHQGPESQADKIKVAPLDSNDLNCPSVDIAEGGASARTGGPDNASVRYQIDISDVSRNCQPRGSGVAINIGVRTLALVGQAGSPGKFSGDLKVLVQSLPDKKPLYQKTYKIAIDTAGSLRGSDELVLDPIVLPLGRTDLDNAYSVTIGLGNSVSGKPVKSAKGLH